MKKTILFLLLILVLFGFISIPFFSSYKSNQKDILNIYVWGNFIPIEIIHSFTQETGIQVNISEYDNNETLISKLQILKKSEYDLTLPSSYYVERMLELDLIQPLNKKLLPNFQYIHPKFKNLDFDIDNKYSVPYIWGSTGIIINTKYISKKSIDSWQDFWDSKYRNQLMLLNEVRDIFSIALLTLGYSINDTNPQHLEKAYLKLQKLLPNIKIFSVDTVPNIYIDEDAIIGTAWGGDYELAKSENENLAYIYPKEGFPLWLDSFVILKNAPHAKNAYKFINFLLRPDIAKEVTLRLGHATANKEALKLLPEKMKSDITYNPDHKIFTRGIFQQHLKPEIKLLYEKYWEKLKLSC